ncbi:hypothetical protein GCM10025865_33660 (plasmid) [Paraoerskovia sediminicola]|uniref:Uncharacterized protein n=1 Tax=Paraoerskovia sediminicola TaxID=1138587 RepID=A0ABN6XGS1_9CELL|nr:hypothetical protein [Paraoerskovia sediminicola]BDZ44024.1 hypothetical protein GCM10025865_33230 [Paraoerskovia sediminicola]BDZ44067.1 hypothetical protein GCM10025865_33660 [Paraoerskovia sediminicola]
MGKGRRAKKPALTNSAAAMGYFGFFGGLLGSVITLKISPESSQADWLYAIAAVGFLVAFALWSVLRDTELAASTPTRRAMSAIADLLEARVALAEVDDENAAWIARQHLVTTIEDCQRLVDRMDRQAE